VKIKEAEALELNQEETENNYGWFREETKLSYTINLEEVTRTPALSGKNV
jgi:uncharacterized protein YgiM (DUF1202 family)